MQALKNCIQHNYPVEFICFDPKCIESIEQIMCKECTQTHNKNFPDHRVIEYPIFKKYIQTFKKEIEYEEIKEIIREYLFCQISEFTILKNDILKQINDFQDSVMASISLEFNEEHEFQIFQGEITLLTKNPLFNKYVVNTSSLNLIKQEMKLNNINLLKEIRNLNEQLRKIFESQKKQINLPQISKSFLFSTKSKHENIEVLENGALIRCTPKEIQGVIGHSQLALCKEPFSPIINKVEFLIKEMSSRNCITFGACLATQIKKNKFFKCWQLGQGTYSLFVNTFGQVKSNHHSNKLHSDVTLKVIFSLRKNWKINKGDTISVEIDFMKQKIVFVRNKKEEYAMPVDIGIQKLYPFVAVSYQKDCVQIL